MYSGERRGTGAAETVAEELDAAEDATAAFQFNRAGDSTENQGERLWA